MQHAINELPIFKCIRLEAKNPEQEALIFVNSDESEERVSYADIFRNTNRFAHALIKAGIGKGDRFTLLMRNHPEFIYALFAALSIGAIAVPIDPRSKGPKLSFQINNTRSKGNIISDEFMENFDDAQPEIGNSPVIGVLYKDHHQVDLNPAYPVLNDIVRNEPAQIPVQTVPLDYTAPAQIIHTSGTTGDPKGVLLKADRYMAYAVMAKFMWGYQADDVLYTGLSLTHGNAQSVTLLPALAIGITAVISEKFTKSRLWDICRKYNCTTFSLLGGMMAGLYNETPKEDDGTNSVRKVISAGTPKAIWVDFEKRFNVKIHEWYAAVEGGLASNPPGFGPVGSFGKPPGGLLEMKIVDGNDNEVGPYTRGELVSRFAAGKTTVDYVGKKKESEEKTRGGWLRSGDICHRDENGFFYFDYRKGGGLRRQGDFIQTDLIEKIIGAHPSVSEVCVYGVPASSGAPGESDLVAAIVPFKDGEVHVESIQNICKKELERNSIPSFFQIIDEMPKTISEKPLERVLQKIFRPDANNVFKFNHEE